MKQFDNITISTLGGHSALEICLGAKRQYFKTLIVTQKGREKTYTKHYDNLVDEYIIAEHFKDLTSSPVIKILQDNNSTFIPHRYVQVYCDLEKLEKSFPVPIFGNKYLLKYEEREGKYTQYQIMHEALLDYPKRINDPQKIKSLVLVKVREAHRTYERSFFFASNFKEFQFKSEKLLKMKKINKTDLEEAVIEEYIIGAQVNFNFFYSPITQELELLGTDTRRQTNIDGLLRIPAKEQLMLADEIIPTYIESGHIAVTVKESILEKAFESAEKLLKATKKIAPPGIIGPFTLQTAILPGPPQEKIVIFDLSFRIPGSPGTVFTPYSHYLYDRPVSFGERIAMEIQKANKLGKMQIITT